MVVYWGYSVDVCCYSSSKIRLIQDKENRVIQFIFRTPRMEKYIGKYSPRNFCLILTHMEKEITQFYRKKGGGGSGQPPTDNF